MMGVTSVDLVDELPNPAITPGQTLEKNVSVVNNGDADMLIRVRFDEKLNTKKLSGGNVVQYGTLLQANLPSTTIVPIKDSVKAQYERLHGPLSNQRRPVKQPGSYQKW